MRELVCCWMAAICVAAMLCWAARKEDCCASRFGAASTCADAAWLVAAHCLVVNHGVSSSCIRWSGSVAL